MKIYKCRYCGKKLKKKAFTDIFIEPLGYYYCSKNCCENDKIKSQMEIHKKTKDEPTIHWPKLYYNKIKKPIKFYPLKDLKILFTK